MDFHISYPGIWLRLNNSFFERKYSYIVAVILNVETWQKKCINNGILQGSQDVHSCTFCDWLCGLFLYSLNSWHSFYCFLWPKGDIWLRMYKFPLFAEKCCLLVQFGKELTRNPSRILVVILWQPKKGFGVSFDIFLHILWCFCLRHSDPHEYAHLLLNPFWHFAFALFRGWLMKLNDKPFDLS